MMTSNHYNKQRCQRERFIQKHIFDDGHIIDGFIINKNHKNGAECHSITDNGIIIIHNLQTGVLITKLIARPNQIKRYYEKTGRKPPLEYKRALFLAKWHESLGYNNV